MTPTRETLRQKGQFWTPRWLAEVMAAWVTQDNPPTLFDPATGPGTFFAAARAIGFEGRFEGFELHSETLWEGAQPGLSPDDLAEVRIADFLRSESPGKSAAIISNPPYLRHHRLPAAYKRKLLALARRQLGFALDGRVGAHVYFLLQCLARLAPRGRLAFLLPADVCEGISSPRLWEKICQTYRLEAVLSFAPEAAPFPGVDTNALVFLISNLAPTPKFRWLRIATRNPKTILHSLAAKKSGGARLLKEGLATGFSRPPKAARPGRPLAEFARVMRGIATGCNTFFFLTEQQIAEANLDPGHFALAVGRTRDCKETVLTRATLARLDAGNRPTRLLSLTGAAKESFPSALQAYLKVGEKMALHRRALIRSRNPWYKMEERRPPPILFAYLGRRTCRFILNEAGVVPLTGFLCVYPYDAAGTAPKKLWRALNHPATLANLQYVGKSYGGGAIKVEPRQLEKLEIPQTVLDEIGLR